MSHNRLFYTAYVVHVVDKSSWTLSSWKDLPSFYSYMKNHKVGKIHVERTSISCQLSFPTTCKSFLLHTTCIFNVAIYVEKC